MSFLDSTISDGVPFSSHKGLPGKLNKPDKWDIEKRDFVEGENLK
jgi:hypothetical protein